MRVVATKTVREYWKRFPEAKQSLLSWYHEMYIGTWNSPNELKRQFKNASIINNKRVVFNIHGNKYRLIVDFEYRFKIVFVIWFGSHKQYDNLDVKSITYVKTNKK